MRQSSTIQSFASSTQAVNHLSSATYFSLGSPTSRNTCRHFAVQRDEDNVDKSQSSTRHSFRPGDAIKVEVTMFGPLGASVDVVGLGHDGDVLHANDEPYGTGLILQEEIAFFREARDNVDVVLGEILNAYVQKQREEDGKINVSLRKYGGKAKSEEVGAMILERLEWTPGGVLNIGEKSSPKEISKEFPGVSKSVFKKALGGLYKKSLVQPGPNSIELMKKD
ncbi:hypothetical protein IV203_026362 [Nitzschia inconspicua]|uniref:Conserved virulence factor B-like winged helix domain-containing protein n=1 Tax=Nitzschia inconspicua TaxID=303405 RepID=A0A9K3LIZ1_9STRA|nr:hypothetical protein IV203_026362 [Nitzschia inconspicua]